MEPSSLSPYEQHLQEERKIWVLPYGIKGRDGDFPLPLHHLVSDEVLCKMVGELAWFSHERIILQFFTRYLLINVL